MGYNGEETEWTNKNESINGIRGCRKHCKEKLPRIKVQEHAGFFIGIWMSRKGLIDLRFLKHTIFRKRVIFSGMFQERESDLKIS